jgi:HSP20 family protein
MPRNIVRWEPFREMENALRHFSPFFSAQSERGWQGEERSTQTWRPAANISETDKEYVIKAELPEVKKEDIDIRLADGVITISGERKYEKEHKDENDLRVESFYGTFARSFSLPDNVDAEKISAECKDGVLRVRIPKTQERKTVPKQIRVN